jgi:hypothetical protein
LWLFRVIRRAERKVDGLAGEVSLRIDRALEPPDLSRTRLSSASPSVAPSVSFDVSNAPNRSSAAA